MYELVINGKFLSQKITGVQRFSLEVLRKLSHMDNLKITVAMPKEAEIPQGDFPNCVFKQVGIFKGNFWEQWSLVRYCKKNKLPLLCMGNIAPFFYKSYVVIHDVTFKEKSPYNNKLWSLKYSFFVKHFIFKSKRVITDSEFSKKRLLHFYPKLKKSPLVVPCGYEHILELKEVCVNDLPDKFYFSVGSVNGNKNFVYILHLAKNNPNLNFVIAGKLNSTYEEFIKNNNIKNCIFTGYVSNEQLIWLYKNCTGFILPSFYEGFGLPPLEAIAVGCRRIYLSDINVFREIYDGCATFFDPYDYENTVDLEITDIDLKEENFNALLQKYSWQNTSDIIYKEIFSNE